MQSYGIYGPVLLTTHPAPRGFLSRYLLGLTPVFLAGFSLLVLTCLQSVVTTFPPTLVQSLTTLVPELPAFIDLTVLLIAPVGIFLLFIYIGDATNHPEMWIGASLTLLLSGIGAFYQVQGIGIPTISTAYLLLFFQWTAYLTQPFSVVASIIVIAGTELFRRSILYTMMRDVVRITGGVWTQVEHLIAYPQIGRIIIQQNRFNRFIHVGTIILAGTMYRGTDTSRNGTAGTNGTGTGYTLVSPEGVHSPLDCLYGIRNLKKVKELLEKKIQQS
ncbi:MAG: PH domain-containing protein [Methanoregula sp.]|nr:PH domain-containing protein [Methanoregula sp.]